MASVVHGLEAEYYGRINFVFLDIDDARNAPFKSQFGFRYQPEFYLLDGQGNVIRKWVGSVTADAFRAAFDQLP